MLSLKPLLFPEFKAQLALFTIAKIWKQPKCLSTDEWMKKINGILLSHKKSKILPVASTWMDLEGTMLGEISQTEKKQILYITYVCNLKNTTKQRI